MGSSEDLQKKEDEQRHSGIYSAVSGEELSQTEAELYNCGVNPKLKGDEIRQMEKMDKEQILQNYFIKQRLTDMERRKEERVWCLSKTEGWVKISDWNYTDEEPDVYRQKPNDTVLVLTCYSAGSKPCPNTCESEKLGEDDEIMAAKEKFGNMPDHPYM